MDKWCCDTFEGLALKPSCPVALLIEILLMILATCCGLISGMTKLVVGLSLDEINFFSFESSRTESLEWSSFPSCFRILVKKSFNSLAIDDSSYTVPFSVSNSTIVVVRLPEPLRVFRGFQIPLGFPLFSSLWPFNDIGSSAFCVGVMIPILLRICLSRSS